MKKLDKTLKIFCDTETYKEKFMIKRMTSE